MEGRAVAAAVRAVLAPVAEPAENHIPNEVTLTTPTTPPTGPQQITGATFTTPIVRTGSPEWTITPDNRIRKTKSTVPEKNKIFVKCSSGLSVKVAGLFSDYPHFPASLHIHATTTPPTNSTPLNSTMAAAGRLDSSPTTETCISVEASSTPSLPSSCSSI